jgi:hypothetical protein
MIRSIDGLARSNGSAAGDTFIAAYNSAWREQRAREECWVASMLHAGATIVTPDDGWVNRREHSVLPPHYARYHIRTPIGGLIALGQPRRWRLVRVIRTEPFWFDNSLYYYFDPLSVMEGKAG